MARTRPYSGRAQPCRRPCPVVLPRALASRVIVSGLPCRNPPSRHRESCRDTTPTAHAWPCVSQGAVVPYRSLYRCPYCDTKAAPSHDTNHCIATHPMARPCAQARAVSRGRADCVAAPLRHVVVCHCAPARPCHAPWRACVLLCQDTVCCIVTKTRKWAIAHPTAFANIFFFICSTYWKTIKYIYIYIYII